MSDVFLSTDQLGAQCDEIVVVDVRKPWEYEEGHIPGAVNIPFDEFRSPTDQTEGKLPTAEDFQALLGTAGIRPDDRIVAYDDEFGVYASRFLVTAEVFGHEFDRLSLLDGDFTAWQAEEDVSTATLDIDSREYRCERTGDGPLIDAASLEEALDSGAVIVDTRDPVEYDTVHVAGAINFQWRDLVDENERRLKSPPRRRAILDENSITMDRPVRLYCNTARRLSFVYAVLRDLGHEDVAFYEGGIDAWADYGGPVETTT